jgi:hypothetical protein
MKKIILSWLLVMIGYISLGQSENPTKTKAHVTKEIKERPIIKRRPVTVTATPPDSKPKPDKGNPDSSNGTGVLSAPAPPTPAPKPKPAPPKPSKSN